ncbi:MAG TPA: DUF5074 domain-containing protein [Flavobacteriales bacterium]
MKCCSPLPYLLVGMMVLSACRKDAPQEPSNTPITVGEGGVYVINEGNFGWGNAGVSYFDIASGNVVEDLYAPANGTSLGDVCQSMRIFNGKGYLVVNNSNKVVVVDPDLFTVTATITGFASPRYLLPVSNAKAYVTDLGADAIAVVDLSNNTITGSIACPGSTEELVLAYGRAFVTDPDRAYLYVIATATDEMVDSIPVSRGGNSIQEDANGKLWVACSGGSGTPPALYRIDPITLAVETMLPFPQATDSPWRLAMNGTRDVLYFLNDAVFRMAITDDALPTAPFIPTNDRNFYGLGVEPRTGMVHVADAIDYVQRGRVFRYAPDGSSVGSYTAGIIPGSFCFR